MSDSTSKTFDFTEEEQGIINMYALVSKEAAENVRHIIFLGKMGIIKTRIEGGQLKVHPVGWDVPLSARERIMLKAYERIPLMTTFVSLFFLGLIVGVFLNNLIDYFLNL